MAIRQRTLATHRGQVASFSKNNAPQKAPPVKITSTVPCPVCKVAVGEVCVTNNRGHSHEPRRLMAIRHQNALRGI